jgi:protein associated with RNAse G/E
MLLSDAASRRTPALAAGTPIPVESTKFDGSLHYRYTTIIVADEGERLRTWGPVGTRFQSYRGAYAATRHFLSLHYHDRDWNLEVMWERDWRPNKHYVNIALPATWEDGTLRFVDLDLDISWWPDGSVRLLDEDEFAEHRERLGYPQWLVDRAWSAVDEVRALISSRRSPFDGMLYRWRPTRRLFPRR